MTAFKILSASRYPMWQIQAIGDTLLREEDKRELQSASDTDPGLALVTCVLNSDASWMMYDRKTFKLVCVFGYSREPSLKGICVWACGTPYLFKVHREFTELTKKIRDNWLNKFGAIYNLIDLRNVAHIQWLIELGFELPPDKQVIMKDGSAFQYFYKEK